MKALQTRVLILIALLAVTASAPVFAELQQPARLVQRISNSLFEAIHQNRETYEQDVQQLEALVREKFLPYVDTYYAARLILGRESRELSEDQIREFADALANLLINSYAEGLIEFESREQVEVMPLRGEIKERLTRVRTRVTMDDGTEVPVDYAFHKTDDGWQAFDILIEGVSYVTTYRNQFGEEIRRDGFDAVLERIKKGEVDVDLSDNE